MVFIYKEITKACTAKLHEDVSKSYAMSYWTLMSDQKIMVFFQSLLLKHVGLMLNAFEKLKISCEVTRG